MQVIRAILLSLVLALTGCASTLQGKAEQAALGDGITTLGGLAMGMTEGSPLGLLTVVAKIPMLAWVRTQPEEERAEIQAAWVSVWGGATANNACIIAAIALTGGALAPLCPMAGFVYAFNEWDKSQPEREFWAICAGWKREFGPQFTCTYTPPKA